MSLKVTTNEKNAQLYKVLITAKYANVQVETNISSTSNKASNGKFPFMESKEGVVCEANTISRHIARTSSGNLYGSTNFEATAVDQYLDFATNDIELPAAVWTYPILGLIANNANATAKAQADIKKSLDFLNSQLSTKTFLVGERITIADIVVAMSLHCLFEKVIDTNQRKSIQNVVRWYTTIVNQANVKSVIGEVKMCEKTEVAPATFTPKVVEKKEEPKKEAPKPKKEEKPKAQEEDEEDETMEDDEPKKASVLDSLPKSSMIFDEWKRVYSNAKDTKGEAMPWLWKNFDANGYCMYMSEYKYNDECKVAFMTSNLINGWIQRLDKLRKYGFGSICIFGDEPNLSVSAVWIFRGPGIPQEMSVTDDSELYTWTKIDPTNPASQALVGDYFAWEGDFGGKKFNTGKIFK